MTTHIQATIATQNVSMEATVQHLTLIEETQQIVLDSPPPGDNITVVLGGPQGPPGGVGEFNIVPVIEEIDTRIATHNQATPIHTNATSGRDFAAFFQNGLI